MREADQLIGLQTGFFKRQCRVFKPSRPPQRRGGKLGLACPPSASTATACTTPTPTAAATAAAYAAVEALAAAPAATMTTTIPAGTPLIPSAWQTTSEGTIQQRCAPHGVAAGRGEGRCRVRGACMAAAPAEHATE